MLTNIESIMSRSMVRSYSLALFVLSFFCIGANIVNVVVFCLVSSADQATAGAVTSQTGIPLTASKIFCLTNGIWLGTLGLILAFICNLIWFEKTALRRSPFASDEESDLENASTRTQEDRIFQLEALLFFMSTIFTLFGGIGVILSGYSVLYETVNYSRISVGDQICYWAFIIQTVLTLGICLTTFSLCIFSFNVLLPLFYSSLCRTFMNQISIRKVPSSKSTISNGWERRSNISFSDSSIQFGTIQTLSDTSVASLKRQLSQIREKENFQPLNNFSSLSKGKTLNSRVDLITI